MGAPFVVREYVRWGDVDIVGIIRYDAYLRFFEYAESELLRTVGLLYHEMVARHAITLPRKVMHAEFITPARLDERLTIPIGTEIELVVEETRGWIVYHEDALEPRPESGEARAEE